MGMEPKQIVASCGAFDNLPPRLLIWRSTQTPTSSLTPSPTPASLLIRREIFLTRSGGQCHPAIITNNLFVCPHRKQHWQAGKTVSLRYKLGMSAFCQCLHNSWVPVHVAVAVASCTHMSLRFSLLDWQSPSSPVAQFFRSHSTTIHYKHTANWDTKLPKTTNQETKDAVPIQYSSITYGSALLRGCLWMPTKHPRCSRNNSERIEFQFADLAFSCFSTATKLLQLLKCSTWSCRLLE